MKAIAVKKSFGAKESLKNSDFSFEPETRTWMRDFASKEEFDTWYVEKFTHETWAGRKGARFNREVIFEFAYNDEEYVKILSKIPPKIELPTLDKAIELVHNGEIENFKFTINGWTSILNGVEYIINGKTYNIPEIRKLSPKAYEEANELERYIAKQYISYLQHKKCNPY